MTIIKLSAVEWMKLEIKFETLLNKDGEETKRIVCLCIHTYLMNIYKSYKSNKMFIEKNY